MWREGHIWRFQIPSDFGSCMATLRIIHTTPKPRTMPHLNPFWKGQGHGVTLVLLPTRSAGSPLVLCHVASQLAQAQRDAASRASHAHQAQAQVFYRAQDVRGSDAQASLCPV